MTTVTAALVKTLRDRTNAGMMECKKALMDAEGDIDKAIEAMRKAGQAKAVKKSSRIAAEGTIVVVCSDDAKRAGLVEVNCETDFVAREEKFKHFAKEVGAKVLQQSIKKSEELQEKTDAARLELVAQLGENITVRRMAFYEVQQGVIGTYAHGDVNGVRIGALVVLKKGTLELARDLAMQVAAMNPEYLAANDVPEARLQKEKEILTAESERENKPKEVLEKIIAGKLKKFTTEITLLGQVFVKDSSKTIEVLLKENGAEIQAFARFAVGEGVEKKEDNFVEEVMAQVRGE